MRDFPKYMLYYALILFNNSVIMESACLLFFTHNFRIKYASAYLYKTIDISNN